MENEPYGIDINHTHQRAVTLIPEDFFWNCADELAPFGSDEGDTALAEYRRWRQEHPDSPTLTCLQWVIEEVGEMEFLEYNRQLLSPEKMKSQLADESFDDQQYIYTLDISVIATGFAQLVDEGLIEPANKEVIGIALERQMRWASLVIGWEHAATYISNLKVLERALKEA